MRVFRLARTLAVLATLLAAAGVRTADAQTGKLSGVVTDAATGQPIEGVQVALVGTGRGAVTGPNGRYFVLTVPPGDYVVTARRIGYQAAERRGVQVRIDVTTEENFQLTTSAGTLQAVRIEAAQQPLIAPGTTGSRTSITAEEIDGLPVTDIAGVLALQLGFLSVPMENPDVTSFVDERRGTELVRVRGGRAAETQTLIDGIPINNFVLGGPGFDITNEAIQQVDFQRGGFEAQYGNAMSGIINYATKEGGTSLKGSTFYQSSRLSGALGSRADEVRGSDFFTGYLSGPVPGTGDRMRFMVAGRQSTGAAAAYRFDDIINNPFTNRADLLGNTPFTVDFIKGWRGVGFSTKRDLFGKLTYNFTPSMKVNLAYIDYEKQSRGFNPAFAYAGYDVAQACTEAYPDKRDYCYRQFRNGEPTRLEQLLPGTAFSAFRGVQEYVVQGSTRSNREMALANFSHTLGRTNYQIRAGRVYGTRDACNYVVGICLGDKIRNFTTAPAGDYALGQFTTFGRHGGYGPPVAATENFAGGDTNTTYVLRGDLQSQVSDHHNIQGGVFYQRHDIRFYEAGSTQKPFDRHGLVTYSWGGKPWDAAAYLQDRIEYDFLTLKLGARFDYTHAPGKFFRNPLDPTNGTTAREVCQGDAFGGSPFTLPGTNVTGLAACSIDRTLLDSATRIAQQDDFGDAPVRVQFSPRVGVQFPMTERSSFFANWGIYSQNPTYNNMYFGTGIGRASTGVITDTRRLAGGGVADTVLPIGTALEGTPYGPNFAVAVNGGSLIPLLGNPQLEIERTSAYEVGFQSEIGSNYALTVTGYAKDQSGLTGFRTGGRLANETPVQDIGTTYNPDGVGISYRVLVNTDYQTVRGAEFVFRRRLQNYWAFSLQYGYQQVSTNAAPPELELQKIIEGDVAVRREIRSEIDQPHLFTGVLRFAFDQQVPAFRFARALRNSSLAFTTRAASGLPYTPISVTGNPNLFTGATSDRQERNSGTGPATWTVDLRAEKGWRTGNLRYSGFVQVNNLLDRKNCVTVYPTTGNCDSGGVVASRSYIGPRQGNGSVPGFSVTGGNSTNYDRPYMYAASRSIASGLRISF